MGVYCREVFAVNILVVSKAYPPKRGGIETYSERVANAYAMGGHNVTVVTTHPGAHGTLTRGAVTVHNVGGGYQPLVFADMLAALRKVRRMVRFDHVHATTWRVALPVLLCKLPAPVISVHGREVLVVSAALRPVMRGVFRRARGIVVVSRPIQEVFEKHLGFAHERTVVGWNGISFPSEAAAHDGSGQGNRVFCLCRLVERKNLPNAVRAVGLLLEEGFDIHFRIGGSGEEAQEIDRAIARTRSGSRICRLGAIDDEQAVEEYRTSSIFLHPQVTGRGGGDIEGFGISIADAMSFGCTVVAGASGGPLDFVKDGVTGHLVDGRDTFQIADCLRSLLGDRGHRNRISAAGRKFALSELTWSRHVEKVIEIGRE